MKKRKRISSKCTKNSTPPPTVYKAHDESNLRLAAQKNACFANAAAQLMAGLLLENHDSILLDAQTYRQIAYGELEYEEGEQADCAIVLRCALADETPKNATLKLKESGSCGVCGKAIETSVEGHQMLELSWLEGWNSLQAAVDEFFEPFEKESICDECAAQERRRGEKRDEKAKERLKKKHKGCIVNFQRHVHGRLPRRIVVRLNRFVYEEGKAKKISNASNPPLVLMLKGKQYVLTGCINHVGNKIESGHFIAYRRAAHMDSGSFFRFDDMKPPVIVPLKDLEQGRNACALLFAYEKVAE
jgi:hypothetical protein